MFSYDYKPRRVCPYNIHVDLSDDGNTIEGVQFAGGCNGNTKAVAKLVKGHSVDEIVALLAGNDCAGRGTSCADQMTIALTKAREALRKSA
ncbi:MAG: TIGR03905 family TSCPD domain-containing protein [Atopobiaceae bacterium]|nr:TIGR03905 family TSCPD domain-containing protein [Atopobiaceae bacterium]